MGLTGDIPALKQALRAAVYAGDAAAVAEALARGAPPNADGRYKGPLLLDAASSGALSVVRALVERGADLSLTDREGKSALHWAAMRGHDEVIRYLQAQRLDVNATDTYGGTPLGCAAAHAPRELVCVTARLLVGLGAEVDPHDTEDGTTPLFNAALRGHADLIRTLAELGADANARAHDGRTALAVVSRRGFRAEVGAGTLIDCGVDVNMPDREGVTPLMFSVQEPFPGVLRLLLDHGAELELRDDLGRTALHHAAGAPPEVGSLSLLKSARENPNFRWGEGNERHLRSEWRKRATCVTLLLGAGADPHVRDDAGRTPADLAEELEDGPEVRAAFAGPD